MPRKTWTERLNDGAQPVLKPAPLNFAGVKAGQRMLVPSARMVDEFIRTIAPGHSLGAAQLRQAMAAAHGAEVCCPIYTGFHLRTVAEAMWEALCAGTPVQRLTPVWRALPERAPTLRKLSFDAGFIEQQRTLERLATTVPREAVLRTG